VSCKVDVKFASVYGQNSGVGFAITHDRFTTVLADLKAGKNEAEARRPFLGIQYDQKSTRQGVELESVQAGTAAEKAGLKARDVIVEFDGRKVAIFDDLREAILRKMPGDKVKLKVLRGEDELEFEVTLGWAPGE
jgi:S1-C subfamily serine protease